MTFTLLWTDTLLWLLFFILFILFSFSLRKPHLRRVWSDVLRKPLAMVALQLLAVFILVSLCDSLHFQSPHATELTSLLDRLLAPIGQQMETTYSAPFATHSYVKEVILDADGQTIRAYPPLKYVGQTLLAGENRWFHYFVLVAKSFGVSIIIWGFFMLAGWLIHWMFAGRYRPSRISAMTLLLIISLISLSYHFAEHYHILGTDKIGQDVFYQTVKSIRTGVIIGTLTTLVILPFAIILGITAGYFGGWVDEIIQYVYTTISSIPGVLLIAASILSLQLFISQHTEWFSTLAIRADAQLLALCLILGVSSWTSLCRLLRAETLKLREMEFVQAAKVLGSTRWTILMKHILPNVTHIILIAVVLDFSTLVLAEAVLSYVGVGVDPTIHSWGNMINSARLELAREPVVWWPLLAAFVLMFLLVLAANLFADAVRDAFDPRHH